ncbi:hypothetical protein SG34_033400 [Thalassomonas viridans]|uniref:Uncharacterized protein n=2 Tax=Thalassomonas viridans TaxID=137584 RepID=A0AAF0CDN2_9GAMM|nr:hypothetical protein SG34_033400 [Thalassomonas viridans]
MSGAQEKKALKQQIQANTHEVFVLSLKEMDNIINASPKKEHIEHTWQTIKKEAEIGASFYATADDLRTLGKLVGDLGGVASKVYIKSYAGKPHIILKGNPGLRKILTGTKYSINNTKVITMGLGRAGAMNAAKSGGILSVVLLTTYRIANYFLTDEATLSQLIGSLATDVVKIGIATGASMAAAYMAGGLTLAVGPIIAVIFVGFAVSLLAGELDKKYGITDRVIDGLEELGKDARAFLLNQRKTAINVTNKAMNSLIDYAIDTARAIIVETAQHYLEKYTPGKPRLY